MLPKKGKKLHLDEEDVAFAIMIAELWIRIWAEHIRA